MDVDLSVNQVESIADFIFRYSHGQEYTESELHSLLMMSSASDFGATAVEHVFVRNHIEQIILDCVPALETASENASPERLLETITKLWTDTVYPRNLADLGFLSESGLDSLRVMFATMVREFCDLTKLLDWLAGLGNVHLIKELCKMGLDEESNLVLAELIPRKIDEYIQSTWKSTYADGVHAIVENWVRSALIPSVQEVLALQKGAKASVPTQQIVDLAVTYLARLRIAELYDIIRLDSRFGLNDLAQALANRPDLRDETVRGFNSQCELRLLNGGSDTIEIIQMLLKTVQAFSILDPQGVLLEKVAGPIRALLKERPDTSVKLAEGLFGEANSPLAFLFDELRSQTKPQTNEGVRRAFLTWTPDPIDTPADFVRKQTQDNVSTLTNLYDNKEVFIKQFVNLFGAELLNHPFARDGNTSRLDELFRLLETRFGASNMQKVAVMLEDVKRSEKVNQKIHDAGSNRYSDRLSVVSPLILSRLYWPVLPKKSANQLLPAQFKDLLENYMQRFNDQPEFNTLELEWLPNRGRVRVEVALADRVLDMVVQPEQAILISAFSKEDGPNRTDNASPALSLAELEQETNLEESQLLAAIKFWVDQGVMGTQGEKYRILETSEEVEEQRKGANEVVSSAPQALSLGTAATAKDPHEDMHVYWSYIVGMLTNLGALPLEKIHSFLVMFVPNEDPYVKTKQELEGYLLAMVDDNKLHYNDSKYSLVNK